MTSRSMSGTRVLVTGGSSGLGAALVAAYRARGARVLVTDLGEPASDATGDYLTLDVRSDADWQRAVAWVDEHWGGLDILVNNAGVASGGRIDVVPMEEWEWVLDINLLGVVRGCRAFTPMFKGQGSGQIVNVASLAGLAHGPGMATYSAAKAGVVALSESLRYELAPYGISTSVVCPFFFRTNLAASLRGSDPSAAELAARMITGAREDATAIAERVVAGVEAGRPLILTDRDGRVVFWGKRLARALYDRQMLARGASMAR